MVKDRVILSTLLVVGGFTLLLNVFYILRNDSSTSKWFHITVDQQRYCSRLLYNTVLAVKRFVLSDLDLKIAVHSLKAIDHQLETSLKDMKPTTAPTELKAAFHGLPVCPEQPPALGQLSQVEIININLYVAQPLNALIGSVTKTTMSW